MRLATAPAWVNWIVTAALTVIAYGPMWLLTNDNRGWPACVLNVTGFSVVIATMFTVIQRPIRRAYAAVLSGLSRSQVRQAISATGRGDIPTDAKVLAAAIRLILITQVVQDRVPLWAKRFQAVITVMLTVFGVVDHFTGDRRDGVFYLAAAMLFVIAMSWGEYARRRGVARLELLRAAVNSADDLPTLTDAQYPPQVSVRQRVLLAVVLVIPCTVISCVGTFFLERPNRSCAHAFDALVTFTHAKDMLGRSAVMPGGPSSVAAHRWSDSIADQASRVTAGDAVTPMQHLADLAQQAAGLVQAARNDTSSPPEQTMQREIAYDSVISQMYTHAERVLEVCRGTS